MKSSFLQLCLLLILLAGPTSADPEDIGWDDLEKGPPEVLKQRAEKARDAMVRLSVYETDKQENFIRAFRGFFISDDGLALFPLYPVCLEKELVFNVADATQKKGYNSLPDPVVLALFPEAGTALLKFDHRPGKHLRLAEEKVPLGSWVSIVTSAEASDPVMGPVMMHREGGSNWTGEYKRQPESLPILYTIAAPGIPGAKGIYIQGDPVINPKGEVVAAFKGSTNLGDVIYRNAAPLHGFTRHVADAVAGNKKSKVPLTREMNPLDPAIFDPLYGKLTHKLNTDDAAGAQDAYDRLAEKHPHSRGIKEFESILKAAIIRIGIRNGEATQQEAADQLLELELEKAFPEEGADWEKAKYHIDLGSAYLFAKNTDKAIKHLKLADELNPPCMACNTLGLIYRDRGDVDQSERYLRRAVWIEPSRAIYWDELSRNPNVSLEESSKIQDRCDLLIKLFGRP